MSARVLWGPRGSTVGQHGPGRGRGALGSTAASWVPPGGDLQGFFPGGYMWAWYLLGRPWLLVLLWEVLSWPRVRWPPGRTPERRCLQPHEET